MLQTIERSEKSDLENIITNIDIDPDDLNQLIARSRTYEYCLKLVNVSTVEALTAAANYYYDGCLDTLNI